VRQAELGFFPFKLKLHPNTPSWQRCSDRSGKTALMGREPSPVFTPLSSQFVTLYSKINSERLVFSFSNTYEYLPQAYLTHGRTKRCRQMTEQENLPSSAPTFLQLRKMHFLSSFPSFPSDDNQPTNMDDLTPTGRPRRKHFLQLFFCMGRRTCQELAPFTVGGNALRNNADVKFFPNNFLKKSSLTSSFSSRLQTLSRS